MQKQISCGKERKKGKMQKILVVEDDWEMNQGICYVLRENGYETACAYSVSEGKEAFDAGGADLVLLDVNLPDGEGFGFCGWLRERSRVPVLFLTARDLEEDALRGYELGAEDYVTKPFSMKILLKKIDVVLKRSSFRGGVTERSQGERTPRSFESERLKSSTKRFYIHRNVILFAHSYLHRLSSGLSRPIFLICRNAASSGAPTGALPQRA